MNKKAVDGLLVILILLDISYDIVIFFSPGTWFSILHGTAYANTQGLLQRTAAVWASFILWQIVALLKWKAHRHWLILVAGVRWTEVFADWTYLYFAQNITLIGHVGLLLAGPINFLAGYYFYRSYFKMASDSGSNIN